LCHAAGATLGGNAARNLRYSASMIDQSDRRFFAGSDVASVISRLAQGLAAQNLDFTQTGPSNWRGRGTEPAYGVVPVVRLSVTPSPDGFCIDARFTLDIEGLGIAVFVVAWFFCFPVAIVLALLAYQNVSTRQQELRNALWEPVRSQIIAPNYAPPLGNAPPRGY